MVRLTRYDSSGASDGHGGPHPLAGVPQHVLDAARDALEEATGDFQGVVMALEGTVEEVAHAVLLAAIVAMRSGPPKPQVTRADFIHIYDRPLTDAEWEIVKASLGWDAVE